MYFVSVKEKLAVDLDSEIATTSLRISLICPVRTSGSSLVVKFHRYLIDCSAMTASYVM